MKTIITLSIFSAFGLVSQSSIAAAETLVFEALGLFEGCDNSDHIQMEEAERNMIRDAKSHCGTASIPIQVTNTFFKETGACIHYISGWMSTATFECVAPSAQIRSRVNAAASVANPDCKEFVSIDQGIGRVDAYLDLSKVMYHNARSLCLQGTPHILRATVKSSCTNSVLTGSADYLCIF